MKNIILKYLIIPILVAFEVVGVAKLYPHCENSFWKLILLYIGVYFTYDLYRWIKNYCDEHYF